MNIQYLKKLNLFLVVLPILIFSLGFMILSSTASSLVSNQLLFFALGFVLFLTVSLIDFEIYRYYWKYLYIAIIVLLLITFVFGERTFGSLSWLRIGAFTIQPAEFAKIVLILTIAGAISNSEGAVKKIKELAKIVVLVAPIILLVLLQPDLGTTLILLISFLVILFYAGINKLFIFIAFCIVGLLSSPVWNSLQPYQQSRILVFLNPTLDTLGSGYNVIQSLIAVGSGGLLGKGFGMGTQSHLQFLPVYWTDFIFAAFAEEWGFLGVSILVCFFLALFGAILYVGYKSKSAFGSLVVIGVFAVFFFQFLINVGMNVGIMPVTGIPLPIISYGGSSMLTSFILLGLVHSIWIYRNNN